MTTHNRTNTPALGAKDRRASSTTRPPLKSTPLVAPLEAWIHRESIEMESKRAGADFAPETPASPDKPDA